MQWAAGLAVLLVAGGPAARADVSEAISDQSVWVMRGTPVVLIALGGEKEKRMGRRMADAGLASQIAAELLKAATHQDRPNDPAADDGFPSGHAAGAWALAEAASMENRKVRPYVYAFAAAVTWSRVDTRAHTTLQALAGAALGYAIGHASARTHGGLFNGLIVEGSAAEALRAGDGPGRVQMGPDGPVVVVWRTEW